MVSVYFTKMKKLWDEYNAVMKMPSCTYGAGKEVVELMQSQRLMQFLMDLNESYKTVRGNILTLPSVSQAYQLVLQEEKQRDMLSLPFIQSDSTAFYSNNERFSKVQGKMNNTGVAGEKKAQLFYRYCKKQGHTLEKCFKLGKAEHLNISNALVTYAFFPLCLNPRTSFLLEGKLGYSWVMPTRKRHIRF